MVLISLQQSLAHRLVDGDEGDGVAALEVAAELHMRDVDAVLAEHRADAADEARPVVIGDVEHARQEVGLDIDALDLDDPRLRCRR